MPVISLMLALKNYVKSPIRQLFRDYGQHLQIQIQIQIQIRIRIRIVIK